MDDPDDERGLPNCLNGEYHDWSYYEAWMGQPAYHYCATCGYQELVREKPELADSNE